jgi:hypothetical protein
MVVMLVYEMVVRKVATRVESLAGMLAVNLAENWVA